jgi:putative ABC transport system substrate-binding protein
MLFEYGIGAKWLELLKEIAPGVKSVAFLEDPAIAAGPGQLGAMQALAPSLGMEVRPIRVRDAGEIEHAMTALARPANGGLIVPGAAVQRVPRDVIIKLAAEHRLPAVYRHPRRPGVLRTGSR